MDSEELRTALYLERHKAHQLELEVERMKEAEGIKNAALKKLIMRLDDISGYGYKYGCDPSARHLDYDRLIEVILRDTNLARAAKKEYFEAIKGLEDELEIS